MPGGWEVSSDECPCGQGNIQTHMSCTDPEPEYGGKCDCDDARIKNAIEITVQCDGHNVTIEEECDNQPCSGTSMCIRNHLNVFSCLNYAKVLIKTFFKLDSFFN